MSLADDRLEIIESIQDDLGEISGDGAAVSLGECFENLSQNFQSLGCCNLLLSADVNGFFKNLFMSGYTRHYFLSKLSREKSLNCEYAAISRTTALFDLIATGKFELAKKIVHLSPDDWIGDGEYEDDFCYFYFFHILIKDVKTPNTPLLKKIIDRFEMNVVDDTASRFAICQSLYINDDKLFEQSFVDLVGFHNDKVQAERAFAGEDPGYDARGNVFVEGLALLRIASILRFDTQAEYLLCPAIARNEYMGSIPDDIYIELERIISED